MHDNLITYIPIPCMCSGIITSDITSEYTYEVSIYHSPIGKFQGPIYAKATYDPGSDGNLKRGNKVQLIMSFYFGGAENKFVDFNHSVTPYILGIFNERTITDVTIDSPNSANDPSKKRWVNDKSGAGIVADDSGKTLLTSGGALHHILSPYGYGSNQHLSSIHAQNHRRTVSHNPPYITKEHFGMFSGSDDDDRLERVSPDDYPINFRRFVSQTRSPNNWTSLNEGAWQPFLGPNNSVTDYGEVNKEVLYTRIVNHGDNRATYESGEPGETFINFRVDRIVKSEMRMPLGSGVGPVILGNKFKCNVTEDGTLDIRAVGAGTPGLNKNKFHISVDSSGNLKAHASGKISLSHGDNDEGINSIVMDPSGGIDITAKNGLRVNGKALVNEDFITWMKTYKTQLCLTGPPGGPAPIHPAALPGFLKGSNATNDLGGFTTKNTGPAATGVITDNDDFSSS